MSVKSIATWVLRLLAAGLLLQTLFFKFTAADESVYIFTKLGVEPWGRIASGIMEAVAAILILIPRTTAYGALLSVGIMAGAIASHLLVLGIEVMNDGGQLFIYACLVLVASLILLVMNRRQLFFYQSLFKTA
jgi:uncharacterized membrane protein YphA (DoxX/SURF4 family)